MIQINELIHYLGAEDGDDDVILELERNAVAFVETQTGRYFGPLVEATEEIDGSGTGKLWLSEIPADNPDDDYDGPLVLVSGAPIGSDALAVESFALRTKGRDSVLVRTDGETWLSGYEYVVNYWKGYAAGEEPGDIRQLVLDLVSAKWQGMDDVLLKSETVGGYSYTRFDASDLAGIVGGQATIDAWRRLVYA